jgi:23S rRNA (cytosine1962-C5)-methyltransferase
MANEIVTIEVGAFLRETLAQGHPWLYRDHVPGRVSARTGDWVEVRAGGIRVVGLWDETSPIAVRLFGTQRIPDERWVHQRVAEAWDLRAPLREAGVTAYRWLFGEGDGLPGLVADLYGSYVVLVPYATSVERLIPWVVRSLHQITPLKGIALRPRDAAAEARLSSLWGRLPPRSLVVEEHGVRLAVDLFAGQKTGLFLDHRANRQTIACHAAGRRVLNLFAYTGAFSLHATRGQAAHVTSVDVAPGAIAALRDNLALNGFDDSCHELVVADVFDYLDRASRERRRFDLVISDPPSFAKRRDRLRQAQRAYVKLTAAGLRVVEPGGLYAAASCTSQVGPAAFREALAEGARKARCRLQIIHEAGQPGDHPVMVHHPEGRYLKFLLARVLPLP